MIIMFMSTTYDRNHIGNEWTCDKKVSEVDVRSNKWDETYQKIHSSSFRQLVGLAIGRWFIFLFAHRARVGRQTNFFFAQRLKKNFFTSILMGRSGNRKQVFLEAIESPCHVVGTHLNRTAFLMSTHNVFYGEINKIIP